MLKATEEKKKLKKAEMANSIIDAAIPFINDHSFTQISIQDFCDKAGITTGMFYRHFKTKNDLLVVVYTREVQKTLDVLPEKIAHLPIKEQLIELGIALSRCSLIPGPDGLLMYLHRDGGGFDCDNTRDAIEKTIEVILNNARENGELLPMGKTAKMLSDDISLLLKGAVFEWYSRREEYDFEASSKSILIRMMPAVLDD